MLKQLSRFRSGGAWLSLAAFIFDLAAAAGAWIAAYSLRFNGIPAAPFAIGGLHALLWEVPIYAVMFRFFGLYRGMWVFASLPDFVRIAKAVSSGAVLVVIAATLLQPTPLIPRSVLLVSPAVLFLFMGGARALYRVAKEHIRHGGLLAQGKPVVVVGAGRAGAALARELAHSSEWQLVGLLDDDHLKIGREIYGHRVLGTVSELSAVAQRTKASHVIIAIPGADPVLHRRMTTLCVRAGLRVLTLPTLSETQNQGVLANVRGVDPEDLLGRALVNVDAGEVAALLAGKTVMVTGAGGSIGSELCRQILKFSPRCLIAYDVSEFAIYKLGEALVASHPQIHIEQLVGDVRDADYLSVTMQRVRPDIVFHAAAYKHVPLMESLNAWQALRNNVLGTYNVARAACSVNVARFVLISTDKAVNPTNVMGASKRLAEMVCQTMQQTASGTTFEIVRFGNVLGSAGSVIPKFLDQIKRGGPVTVTHPDITRFFMTISEASQLVLHASALGRGGEIFVLDMGDPMRIADLARDMIRLHGYTEEQIPIEFTGLRPGEKLYEELLADEETTRPTPHPKLRIARAREADEKEMQALLNWLQSTSFVDDETVRDRLSNWVPEYVATSALL